jgi:aspartate-semialdehyde dehydrogenase
MGTKTYSVGILGATGIVGQRLVRRLEQHPWFRLERLAASRRSVGKAYGEAVNWTLDGAPPTYVSGMEVLPCEPGSLAGCDLVFSSLDAAVAVDVEASFSRAGIHVISNSSAYRMDPAVPLVIPEINASHLDLLGREQGHGGRGHIVTNPNCSVIGLAVALAPLHREFGVQAAVVTTLQALSGAGLSGPTMEEMEDNALPHIRGEEEKIQEELPKILGRLGDSGGIEPAAIRVAAHCNRIGTVDGHLETVSVRLDRPATPEQAVHAFNRFRGEIEGLGLPTAPPRPIEVLDQPDRPQPRLDRDTGAGMTVVIGRVRPCPVTTLRFSLLSHNTERGAAGAALLNGELMAVRGLLGKVRS